jgi:hypothetical protein
VSAALRVVYLLALVVWVGEIVFFSFVVAPAIFGVLGAVPAGDVVGAIFPRYYAIGAVAAGLALLGAWRLRRGAERPGLWTAAVVALALGFAVTTWAGAVVHPRARALRAARQAAGDATPGPEFDRAHREAVLLNGTALLAGLAALGFSATALRP